MIWPSWTTHFPTQNHPGSLPRCHGNHPWPCQVHFLHQDLQVALMPSERLGRPWSATDANLDVDFVQLVPWWRQVVVVTGGGGGGGVVRCCGLANWKVTRSFNQINQHLTIYNCSSGVSLRLSLAHGVARSSFSAWKGPTTTSWRCCWTLGPENGILAGPR